MEKPFLILALLGGTTTVSLAQSAIPAGTISVGGGIGYSRSTFNTENITGSSTYTGETTNSEFRFSPSAGYFLADNLAIGIGMSYAARSTSITFTGPGTTSPNALDPSTSLRVGPYVQYYKMISDQFGVLGTLSAGYVRTFTPFYVAGGGSTGSVIESKSSGFYTGLTPSIIFMPIPKFGITASIGNLGFSRVSMEESDDDDGEKRSMSDLNANFGFDQLMFGGIFFLGRK